MNCESFQNLTIIEQKELVQKLVHLAQTNERMFRSLTSVVRQAENNGLLDDLKVFPENIVSIVLET